MAKSAARSELSLTRVALVGVGLDRIAALGELEDVLGDDLVHGESTTAKDLAGVTVAVDKRQCYYPWILRWGKSSATYHKMCFPRSWLSSAVQVVWPQWQAPWYEVIVEEVLIV